jgi:hypothetical protein
MEGPIRRTDMRDSKPFALILALALLVPAAADAKRNDPNIPLTYTPTTSVAEASAVPTSEMRDVAVAIEVEDDRAVDEPVIGARTNDDDQRTELRATNDVTGYVQASLIRQAREWTFKTAEGDEADAVLAVRLTQFAVEETNQALGATYEARVTLELELRRDGEEKWSEVVSGDATRFGKKFSVENANEVLSDALAEAFANGLNDSGLRDAWTGD